MPLNLQGTFYRTGNKLNLTTCQESFIFVNKKHMTQTMFIGEFKARFSEVVELLEKGVIIKVVKGKSVELVGYFGREIKHNKPMKRKLGFFSDAGVNISKEDLKWTDDELAEFGL
jgi:hypothetical protein